MSRTVLWPHRTRGHDSRRLALLRLPSAFRAHGFETTTSTRSLASSEPSRRSSDESDCSQEMVEAGHFDLDPAGDRLQRRHRHGATRVTISHVHAGQKEARVSAIIPWRGEQGNTHNDHAVCGHHWRHWQFCLVAG